MARREPDSDQQASLPPIESVRVGLGPVLGIPPRIWVTALWGLAVLAFLVWLLLFPGIREPGSVVRFSSLPPGASVYLGESYLTDTPGEAYVPRGTHTFSVRSTVASEAQVSAEIGGRVFASRIFPRRQALSVPLASPDSTQAAREYQVLSARPEPIAEDPIPRILSGLAPGMPLDAASILRLATHAQTPAARADLLGAVLRSGSGSGSASPLALVYRMQVLDASLRFVPELAEVQLSGAGIPLLAGAARAASVDPAPTDSGPPQPEEARVVSGLRFVGFGRGTVTGLPDDPRGLGIVQPFPEGASPVLRELAPFLLQDREMSLAAVSAVLGESEAQEIAGAFASPDPAAPLSGMTAGQARAILSRMSSEIPGTLRLPSDIELAAAQFGVARGAISGRNDVFDSPAARPLPSGVAAGLHDIEGNLWELTETEFAPLMDYGQLPALDSQSAFGSVRGGSFISRRQLTGTATRGALPADLPSPYTGFRAVWVPED